MENAATSSQFYWGVMTLYFLILSIKVELTEELPNSVMHWTGLGFWVSFIIFTVLSIFIN